MNLQSHRPSGHTGKKEYYLSRMAKDLVKVIMQTYGSFDCDTLCLSSSKVKELAGVLVEFAEDVHNDIGIWKSLERYNIEFFGTPLPLIRQPHQDIGDQPINEHRVQHFLWVVYSELYPELIVSPTHQDLNRLAAVTTAFLNKRFANIPPGSSVKTFLSGSNIYGWEVKRKLIWLGTHSYLFRNSFHNYVEGHDGKPEVPVIDDFVCRQTTNWSGLAAIDILASILDITEEQRFDLRSWYRRHFAYYRIVTNEGDRAEVINIINDQPYTVRLSEDNNPFKVGAIVLGSLVPWDGYWYWSGIQYVYDKISRKKLQNLKETLLKSYPLATYVYCPQLAEKARGKVNRFYQKFLEYHKADIAIYPDGLSMAADYQKEIRLQWESMPSEILAELIKKHNLREPSPSLSFPNQLIDNEGGVAVFYNPDEGHEFMTGFNMIINGFKKKGTDLTEGEGESIRAFILSNVISPKFVRRMIEKYGSESIEAAFLIRENHNESHIEYLLRRYKGDYYRKRYPRITLL